MLGDEKKRQRLFHPFILMVAARTVTAQMATTRRGASVLKLDKTEVLNPNPDKGTVNEKMNAKKKEKGEPPSDKMGAKNITQKGEPFSFQVDKGWTVHSNMHGKG